MSIAGLCSSMGAAMFARAKPELQYQLHDCVSRLHTGRGAKILNVE